MHYSSHECACGGGKSALTCELYKGSTIRMFRKRDHPLMFHLYPRLPHTTSLHPCAGKIDHHWVASEWATECGFQHLSETLLANMVDGRVLNSLTKDDLKRHLKISKKLDQLSFTSAVELLRMHDFDREVRGGRKDGG